MKIKKNQPVNLEGVMLMLFYLESKFIQISIRYYQYNYLKLFLFVPQKYILAVDELQANFPKSI
ncbi:hypothetical protein BpHYR1_004297 [Brachionus plicatilis]|uniref:Uncharacterized protein n=1 Tax=Brachionus plicatilis TaxID=10195 RepID=A0A3M7Q7L3_BRAPC|nr:hypothetical protein BpHYR1_004297 [Brachionus plicatilis]